MAKFDVFLSEVLGRSFEIEAENEEEARKIVRRMYRNEEVVLGSEESSMSSRKIGWVSAYPMRFVLMEKIMDAAASRKFSCATSHLMSSGFTPMTRSDLWNLW